MAVEHKIEFARHPNGRDIVVECSCKFSARALNGTDAQRLARTHIEGERQKEMKSNDPD